MVFNLVDRAIPLSHKKHYKKNLEFVKTNLLSNEYPLEFIKNNIEIRMKKLKRKNGADAKENKNGADTNENGANVNVNNKEIVENSPETDNIKNGKREQNNPQNPQTWCYLI